MEKKSIFPLKMISIFWIFFLFQIKNSLQIKFFHFFKNFIRRIFLGMHMLILTPFYSFIIYSFIA